MFFLYLVCSGNLTANLSLSAVLSAGMVGCMEPELPTPLLQHTDGSSQACNPLCSLPLLPLGQPSLPLARGCILLSWSPRSLRDITLGRMVEGMSFTHLSRQFSVQSYYFLAFRDSPASQCDLNQASINTFF